MVNLRPYLPFVSFFMFTGVMLTFAIGSLSNGQRLRDMNWAAGVGMSATPVALVNLVFLFIQTDIQRKEMEALTGNSSGDNDPPLPPPPEPDNNAVLWGGGPEQEAQFYGAAPQSVVSTPPDLDGANSTEMFPEAANLFR